MVNDNNSSKVSNHDSSIFDDDESILVLSIGNEDYCLGAIKYSESSCNEETNFARYGVTRVQTINQVTNKN